LIVRVLVLVCLVVLSAACQRDVGGMPVPASVVDTLPLGLDRVRQISGFERLTREADSDQPWQGTTTLEGPCGSFSDRKVAYGETLTAFRSVTDAADLTEGPLSPIVSITQNVAAYPSDDDARSVFDRRIEDASACAALNTPGLGGAVSRLDENMAVWGDEDIATVFAIRSSTLVETSAVGLPEAERIATEISRAILDRIPSG
jgi:PknH-like extracellular domain